MSELGQKIIAEVRKVAAESKSFIYEPPLFRGSCVYIYDGSPSCIIGCALWNLELIDATCPWDAYAISDITSIINSLDWQVDENEKLWLLTVQQKQDVGISWGRCIELADENVQRI